MDGKWVPYAARDNKSFHPIGITAFQHFLNCSTETIAQPGIREVMTTDVIRTSFNVRAARPSAWNPY